MYKRQILNGFPELSVLFIFSQYVLGINFVERKTIKNTYKIRMIVKYDIFFTPLFPKYSFIMSVVMKTAGQIRTPTDKLKFFTNEKSKILVPKISAIIAFVIKIPVRIMKILFNLFFSSILSTLIR